MNPFNSQQRSPAADAGSTSIDDELCAAVQWMQARHRLFPTGAAQTPVVVGVSGGADSVCLLHILLRHARAWQLRLHVAHVDHNLRPNSAADAAFVAEMARHWDLPFHSRRLATDALDGNREEAARRARYAFFVEIARQIKTEDDASPMVAVAHTADDQAETVLMHLLRGSGLEGLAGMRPRSPLASADAPVWLVRPLLHVHRAQILRYLDAADLPWREDPTNRDLGFTRNWLRHEVLPLLAERNPNVGATLARTATILAAEADRAEQWNRQAFIDLLQSVDRTEDGRAQRVVLDRNRFVELDVATQRGVLRQAWAQLPAPMEMLTFEQTESVRHALSTAGEHAGPIPIAAGIAWSVWGSRLSLHLQHALPMRPEQPLLDSAWRTHHAAIPIPVDGVLPVGEWELHSERLPVDNLPEGWRNNADPWQAFLDADRARRPVLRTPQTGDRMAPLGMEGHHKSLGDLFTDCKVPPVLRDGWPIVVDDASGAVMWVCGLRVSHETRITARTRRVLHLRWMRGA